jgi:hypothetical protein
MSVGWAIILKHACASDGSMLGPNIQIDAPALLSVVTDLRGFRLRNKMHKKEVSLDPASKMLKIVKTIYKLLISGIKMWPFDDRFSFLEEC